MTPEDQESIDQLMRDLEKDWAEAQAAETVVATATAVDYAKVLNGLIEYNKTAPHMEKLAYVGVAVSIAKVGQLMAAVKHWNAHQCDTSRNTLIEGMTQIVTELEEEAVRVLRKGNT